MEEELFTVGQIAKQLELAENTTRRYVKQFRDFLPVRQAGRITKYSSEAIQIVAQIAAMYQQGLHTPDIEKRLKHSLIRIIDIPPESSSSAAVDILPDLSRISGQLERQQHLIENLTERLDKQQAYIEDSINRRDQHLMAVIRELLENKKQLTATEEKKKKKRWWPFR